jgi:hypothetical protein
VFRPFFSERTVTGIVEEFLIPILEEAGPDDTLSQQDGLPPHFHKELAGVFNRKNPEKYIGRGGPITWPPRSPALTPLDFLFGGGGVHQGSCVHATIGYQFAGTWLEDKRCSGYAYPRLA